MANLDLGPAYEEIGQIMASDLGVDPDGAFMYVEAGEGWVEPSLFKDIGDKIIYKSASRELCEKLYNIWEAEEPDKRWAALQYTISEGQFRVKLQYPEDLDPEESSIDRRPRVLKEKFGDKPIDYSDP